MMPLILSQTAHENFYNTVNAIAKFEQKIISHRTKLGLNKAKNKGIQLGRKPGLSTKAIENVQLVKKLYQEGNYSVGDICRQANIAKSTFYRYINNK